MVWFGLNSLGVAWLVGFYFAIRWLVNISEQFAEGLIVGALGITYLFYIAYRASLQSFYRPNWKPTKYQTFCAFAVPAIIAFFIYAAASSSSATGWPTH